MIAVECPSCLTTVEVEPSKWQMKGGPKRLVRYHCPRCDEDIWRNTDTGKIGPYPSTVLATNEELR